MLSEKHANWLLTAAAIFVGMAIPSLFFGRAVIGGCLGLALICTLIAFNHKKTYKALCEEIPRALIWLIALCMITSAINIPFSLRINLSFEAWLRTWLLLLMIGYILYGLKDHLKISLITLSIGLFTVLVLTLLRHQFFFIQSSKAVLNGFLLTLPLCLYLAYRYSHPVWKILALSNITLFAWFAISRPAKASVAGLVIMVLAGVLFFTLSRFRLRTAFLVTFGVLGIIGLGLAVWLPDSMNATSADNRGLTMIPVWAVDLHRQLIWSFALDRISESPWVGYGLNASNFHPLANQTIGEYFGGKFSHLPVLSGSLVLPSHPHNAVIEMLLDGGIIAFIPLFAAVFLLFARAIIAFWHHKHPALLGFIVVNVGYWGTGLLNFSFWSVWWQVTYFVSAGIFLCLYLNDRKAS